MAFTLTKEQEMAVNAKGSELLVSAAAGSGKTRVLVERVIERICGEEQCDIDQFLIITFTKAAALEMKTRIKASLQEQLRAFPNNLHLRKQSELMYKAKITTIDSFCSSLVRDYAHLVGLPSNFRVSDGTETNLIRDQILDDQIEEYYENGHEDFLYLCDTLAFGRDDKKLREIILSLHNYLQSHLDADAWISEALKDYQNESDNPGMTKWGREILSVCKRKAEYGYRMLHSALVEMKDYPVLMDAYGLAYQNDLQIAEKLISLCKEENWQSVYDTIANYVPMKLKSVRKFDDPEFQKEIKNRRETWKDSVLSDIKELINDDEKEAMSDISNMYPVAKTLFDFLRDYEERFLEEKKRRGLADFSDIEHYASQLISVDGTKTNIGRELSDRYVEIMVDEYQDINECQESIIQGLSRNNVFYVGDMKQSIYRFRLADPTIFLKKYREFKLADQKELNEPSKLLMSYNFRSRNNVLQAVNQIFEAVMKRETAELDYTEKEELYLGNQNFIGEDPNPELILIDYENRIQKEDEPDKKKDEIEAEVVAERIFKMLIDRENVTDGDTERPVRPGDIAILMRSPGPHSAYYEKALREKGIPCIGLDRGGHWTGIEWSTPISILHTINNPREDIPLVATLRSPLFSFTSDELASIRATSKETCFYDAVLKNEGKSKKVDEFLSFIREMRMIAPDLTAEEMIRTVLDKTNLYAIVGTMEEGKRRQEDLDKLLELARNFEKSSYKGLFSFLQYLEKFNENPEFTKADEGHEDAVHIISIHHSKGLQYPVVFVSNLGGQFNLTDFNESILMHPQFGVGFKWTDRDRMVKWDTVPRKAIEVLKEREMRAEEMRLLYVAMTRAVDKLILTGSISTMDAVTKTVNKAYIGEEIAVEGINLVKCPLDWIIDILFYKKDIPFGETIQTKYLLRNGEEITWDITVQGETENEAEKQTKDSDKKEETVTNPPEEMVKSIRDKLDYRYPYMKSTGLPSKITPTDLKGRFLDEESQEDTVQASGEGKHREALNKPRFIQKNKKLSPTQKGTAVHLAMQFLDYNKCNNIEEIEKQLDELSVRKIMSKEQREAVDLGVILNFFKSGLAQRLKESEEIKREFKFSILVPASRYYDVTGDDQILLQGVIDCAFVENGKWTVMDFKTDHVLPGKEAQRAEHYKIQLQTYGYALKKITGREIGKMYVIFLATGKDIEIAENKGE